MRTLLTISAILMGTSSYAATVASGHTSIGDQAGIVLQGADVSVAAKKYYGPAKGYRHVAGTVGEWVWTPDGEYAKPTYEFRFNLSGFDISTVSLLGNMAVDNTGSAKLNGHKIFALDQFVKTNFSQNHAFGTNDTSLFNAGENILTFDVTDLKDYYGFVADVTVTADRLDSQVAPVPLPAGMILMLSGLGGSAAFLRRKKG